MTSTEILLKIYDIDKCRIIQYLIRTYAVRDCIAEDVIQDVFLKLYQRIDSIKPIYNNISGLIWMCCKNKCIDYIRRDSKIDFDSEIVNDVLNKKSCNIRCYQKDNNIVDIFKKLNDKDKSLIEMFYYENLSIKEISKILNMSTINVKVRLCRVRAKIRKMIK